MNGAEEMYVIKRNGSKEPVAFEKVAERLRKAASGLHVNVTAIAQKVLAQIVNGIKTSELDVLAAALSISNVTVHPDYGVLAANIIISNHQRNTPYTFAETVKLLHNQKNKLGKHTPLVSDELLALVEANADLIESRMVYDRDYKLDFFGFKTLEKAYLLRDSGRAIIERPQHMWMRVSLGLWGGDLQRAFETYDMMSVKQFTHATPTLFNCGTQRPQLSSCFLLAMKEDSITGIYDTLKDCATISKFAGGIGLHIHNIRASGSMICGTNGTSNGIVPMLRNFNMTARYVDQCFTPDTLVYTDKGPKPIEDISVCDKVLTSTGTYEKVLVPVRHEYNGVMLDIQIKGSTFPVRTTPEHQILALTEQAKGLNFDVIKARLDKGYACADFHDAKDLQIGDFLVFPIPKYEVDIEQLTTEDCRFYGIMLGDGYISGKAAGLRMSTITKVDASDFVKSYLGKKGIIVTESIDADSPNSLKLTWSSIHPGFKFTHSQLYDDNGMKRVDGAFIHLPKLKILQLIRGLIETDGCVGSKEITVEVTSDSIIESLRYMLLRLGGLASGYARNRIGQISSYKNITTRLETQVIRIPRIPEILELFPNAPESRSFNFMRYGDNLYSRIESINETAYDGIVHDFEIDGPHDYVVSHMGVAHNGGGKRNGSFAVYLEPWHADIHQFLELKRNNGNEEERCRDLFYAVWVPDLFMERVRDGGSWTLFCPSEAPGLADVVGDDFKRLYEQYEADGRGRSTIPAQKLWFEILDSQIETGTPYLVYKDAANKKSNQKNVGVIKSSNLCSEIIEYSSADETAVCNLASMALPTFVVAGTDGNTFDFVGFRAAVKTVVTNLNRVIDVNYYPTEETKRSNMRHRPVGLGVQGLADVFALLKVPWERLEDGRSVANPDAVLLNKRIFAHMYYAAVSASVDCAAAEGPYSTFAGSPASQGLLQFDLWNVLPLDDEGLDWSALKERVKTVGLRNSLLIAPMPTASTSQILGFNECFEPFTTNIYKRLTLAGEFIQVNKYLVADLIKKGLWSTELKDRIIANKGSVQGLSEVPEDIQALYKTVWELKQKTLIDLAADRGAYICQSQSLNLFVADPDYSKLTSMHFYAWNKGLKTGVYYLRTKAPVVAQQFTVDPTLKNSVAAATAQEKECLMCSS